MEIPGAHRNALVQRLKIMAKLDISEKRKPQDGKIRFKYSKGTIELRVATIPTANQNEDVVMRILAASKPLPLDKMGFSERNLAALQDAPREAVRHLRSWSARPAPARPPRCTPPSASSTPWT